MWNHISSAITLWCTRLFAAVVLIALPTAPWWVAWYLDYTHKSATLFSLLLTYLYLSAVPAVITLYCLEKLMRRIRRNEIFIPGNVALLRVLSWCCVAVSLISLGVGIWYLPFLIITAAAGFIALILRVLKNVMEAATQLKTENDLTV